MSKKETVCVVGGGIAGCSCAWSLDRSGFEVTLFESREELGGNAKTHTWKDSGDITTGLSVLAWPEQYFHTYNALLDELKVEKTDVELPFVVKKADSNDFWAHEMDSSLKEKLKPDVARFLRLVAVIRFVSDWLASSSSFYALSFLNPFNFLPIRLMLFLFCISSEFYHYVLVPLYSSSFLTVYLSMIPSVILPKLVDIIPLTSTPVLTSWKGTSREVFQKLTERFAERVFTDSAIQRVEFENGVVNVQDRHGKTHQFQKIVFACNATAAYSMLKNPSIPERCLLYPVGYTNLTDKSFDEGIIHTDAAVIPEVLRNKALERYANYIEVSQSKNGYSYENTFILSSWYSTARNAKKSDAKLVTYNCNKNIATNKWEGKVSNDMAHPCFSFTNQFVVWFLRYAQGSHDGRSFYCGSYTTPGNGHDLSLLSGLIVAHKLGADFPLPNNVLAKRDFELLKKIMGI